MNDMENKAAEMGVFEMVMAGLQDSIAYSKGDKKSLVTTEPSLPCEMDQRRINMDGQDGQDE